MAAAPRLIAAILALPLCAADPRAFFASYCTSCHNQRTRAGALTLDADPTGASLEAVIARLRAGSMPPPGLPRPNRAVYRDTVAHLEALADRAWAANPVHQPPPAVHRLNRVEYNSAIRDLLALDIDVKPQLPGDETADGSFDNFGGSLSISTAHVERYLSVARQVTRLAVGLPPSAPRTDTFEMPKHVLQQDRQSELLPYGTRGGIGVRHNFPVSGVYLIKTKLQRQYQDYLKGAGWPQQIEIRVDGLLIQRFTVGGSAKGRAAGASYAGDGEPGYAGDPEWEQYMQLTGDAGLEARARVTAGPHTVAVSFVREMFEPEGLPQPLQRGRVIANDQVYMDHANVGRVDITGPIETGGPTPDTPSRRAIFTCTPVSEVEERPCAASILTRLARLAYRRAPTEAERTTLLKFFEQGRRNGSFNQGIQLALERLLVDPDFLLRLHRPGRPLTDVEIASRLSFFLWSSIPGEALLRAAERGELSRPGALDREVLRMLADPRAAHALVEGFAAQWLNLRRVGEVVVDPVRYPNYDESLIQAFERETGMFVEETIRSDAPLATLLNANFTFVNERLARHYGIPGVSGSRFRRVEFVDPRMRGGLLGHGAVLATTSYPDRTSPVLRGKWLLNNILGLPVPPPPPGLDTNLAPQPGGIPLTIRERLARHRSNASCNACHTAIDPLGFALENFDVIGGWRLRDESGHEVDSAGETADGSSIEGLAGLRDFLLRDPESFPRTVTEKLMSYALGRRLDHADQPAVRAIVRDAAPGGYRWSGIILGIVRSPAFSGRVKP